MATHGSIREFNSTIEDWTSYTERLEQYFTANSVRTDAGEQRRAIQFGVCCPTTYQLIRSFVVPDKVTDKSYTELVQLVREQQPTPSFIVQHCNFHTRAQKPRESISEFVAQLRNLPEHCRFGDQLEDMLREDMLRDRILCDCSNKHLQTKLLSELELTFDKSFKTARAMETAEHEAKELNPHPVHSLHTNSSSHCKPTTGRKEQSTCYRCGGKHLPDACKFKSET